MATPSDSSASGTPLPAIGKPFRIVPREKPGLCVDALFGAVYGARIMPRRENAPSQVFKLEPSKRPGQYFIAMHENVLCDDDSRLFAGTGFEESWRFKPHMPVLFSTPSSRPSDPNSTSFYFQQLASGYWVIVANNNRLMDALQSSPTDAVKLVLHPASGNPSQQFSLQPVGAERE